MASIRIDGEIYNDVTLTTGGYLPMVEYGRMEWHIAQDFEQADDATLAYWHDMAKHDPKELVCLVGEERIIRMWSAGETLDDFVQDIPASEQWASYDGSESDIEPPTPHERTRVAQGPRWLVAVTEPGGLSHAWEQSYESEVEAETAAHAWAGEVEDRDFMVSLHPDDEDLEELAEFVAGWDELVEELGYEPTVAYRHN
jgi:hypothetical protein